VFHVLITIHLLLYSSRKTEKWKIVLKLVTLSTILTILNLDTLQDLKNALAESDIKIPTAEEISNEAIEGAKNTKLEDFIPGVPDITNPSTILFFYFVQNIFSLVTKRKRRQS